MRTLASALLLASLASPAAVMAQSGADEGAPPPPAGGVFDPASYASLTADDEAQMTLGGFRNYLERISQSDPGIYRLLDPRLDDLEYRDTAADVVFGVSFGLGLAALGVSIPIYTEIGETPGIGLIVGGLSAIVIGIVIQAIVRPGHPDLVALIDLHDERVGRR
jgi:hypothetical protein